MYDTSCGGAITIPTSTLEHLTAHMDVFDLLPEAIRQVTLPTNNETLVVEVKMGRIVGRSGRVTTPPIGFDEATTFAIRLARPKASRVALKTQGAEVDQVVIIAGRTNRPKQYRLITAYIGTLAPREPWDRTLTDEGRQASLQFWSRQALVYDPEVMGEPFRASWKDILG